MSMKVSVTAAVLVSPLCLALGTLAAPKIAYLLLGLNFVGVPVGLVLIGALFVAYGVLFFLRDPIAELIIN